VSEFPEGSERHHRGHQYFEEVAVSWHYLNSASRCRILRWPARSHAYHAYIARPV